MPVVKTVAQTTALILWVSGIFFSSIMYTGSETKAERSSGKSELATLGGGCFWCTEAVFETFKGVKSVTSGYAGGTASHPNYKQVCSGTTGHAEVIQIAFDPEQISYEQLLDIFWEAQKKAAERSKAAAANKFKEPIVTEIVPLRQFYPAEEYHQDYFRRNPSAPYCVVVISPKLKKLQKRTIDLPKNQR